MALLFSTGSLYRYSIARTFDFAAQAGFDGVELMVDQRWDTRQPDFIRRLIDDTGQPVRVVHSPFGPTIPGWPNDEAGRIAKSVELAEALGAVAVVHHLPTRFNVAWVSAGGRQFFLPWPGRNPHRDYMDWLTNGQYRELQAGTDVLLCIENMPAKTAAGRRVNPARWNTPDEILRFDSLTMDTTHLGTWGLDPVAVFRQWGERVKHIHLSNFDGREHRRPEAGHLPLAAFLGEVARSGYAHTITLELHGDTLDAGQPDAHIVGLLRDSLTYCREALDVKNEAAAL